MKKAKSKFQISNFKLTIIFFLASCILYFASVSEADAAYKIYLKNGSVISGVSSYNKSEGEIKFYFEGGMIGIPEKDILKIESGKEPVKDMTAPEKPWASPPARAVKSETPEVREEVSKTKKEQPEKGEKLAEIAKKEEELKKTEGDLIKTRVRVQNLSSKSNAGTISSDERTMLQINMHKKDKLEEDKKRLSEEIKSLKEKLEE